MGTRFQFEVVLLSSNLPDYSFTIFEFGYNVSLYPVIISLSHVILVEMQNKADFKFTITSIGEETQFRNLLELIFQTSKFKEIVAGLMKISKRREEKSIEFEGF